MTGLKPLCWIGFSVGLAAAIGTMRFLYGWSLKPFIYGSLTPMLALTLYGASDPDLTKVLGLAWDAGAVTTRPVTVPLVLALGIGIAMAARKGDSRLSGFGIELKPFDPNVDGLPWRGYTERGRLRYCHG